jgi:elongation factor Ts
MEITASMVKELRERSGAGMMECKKALTENDGDVSASIEWLRKQGLAKADKKASRIAAEGRIVLAQSNQSGSGNHAVLVEINSETDFVAKDQGFLAFADIVAQQALASGAKDVEALKQVVTPGGTTIEEARQALVAKVGENVQIRRLVRIDSANRVAAYLHGGRIGVLIEMKGGSDDLARGLAMHVAAMNPPYISPDHVPAAVVAKEKEIALAQMTDKDRAKPPEIQEKMIGGKIRKTLAEMSLTGQAYVLDTNVAVDAALKKEGATVVSMNRIAVGEGIEKKEEDFAAEVMKQAGLAH